MEKLALLESVLGQGHKSNRDYYQFNCPFCQHHKPKLGISLGTGKWKCWVCGVNGSKVTFLFRKLNAPAATIDKAKNLFVEVFNYKRDSVETLSLPKEFTPLWVETQDFYFKKAKGYLLGRGVTELDIFKHRIGYCTSGKYKDMIVFPFYSEDGTLIYFTGRSYNPTATFTFNSPINVDKNLIYDEHFIAWSEPLIIVESKLDAIIVRRNAIPLNGKQIQQALLEKILEENVSKVILCLDGDALKDAMKYGKWFNQHGIEVWVTKLPIDRIQSAKKGKIVYHDPTSLGHDKTWEYIEKASKVQENDSFKYDVLSKLMK